MGCVLTQKMGLSPLDVVATLLEVLGIQLQAGAPLHQGDAMVLVGVAGLEEGCDAVLETDQRSTDGEELVARDGAIGIAVQVAPLPHGGVRPATRVVGLRLQLHLHVVLGQLVALGQVAHHVEQPVAHAPGEVLQVLALAAPGLVASAVVVDVHVRVVRIGAAGLAAVAPAALLIHRAVRRPGLVGIGADQAASVHLLRALRNAHAFGLLVVHLADATGSAAHRFAQIHLDNGIE